MVEHTVSPFFPSVHSRASQAVQLWYLISSWNLPDGQWKQLVLPAHFWYLPAVQLVQVAPVYGWNLPTGQSVHSMEPSIANWPTAHGLHAAAL
jgi:hypothetical protein